MNTTADERADLKKKHSTPMKAGGGRHGVICALPSCGEGWPCRTWRIVDDLERLIDGR